MIMTNNPIPKASHQNFCYSVKVFGGKYNDLLRAPSLASHELDFPLESYMFPLERI